MSNADKVNILLVDDQPAKLLAYEVILRDLGENLIKASSGREALEHLLKTDVAVVLIDVCMPELDGFQLAAMIREHPRFQQTAIIFISAVQFTDLDRVRGYEMGAVDYVPVPVVPEVLKAKIKIFTELFRKTRQLEALNRDLEDRVRERTLELEQSAHDLRNSERRRTLALAAGRMGSWDWDVQGGICHWDEGQYGIVGAQPHTFPINAVNLKAVVEPEDWDRLLANFGTISPNVSSYQEEVRIRQPGGDLRWCLVSATPSFDADGKLVRMVGVTVDITERKLAEEKQTLLTREVDHRARNALAIVQSIVRLTNAPTTAAYVDTIEGRIKALSRVHSLLSQLRWEGADLGRLLTDELEPFKSSAMHIHADGPTVSLKPPAAQALALALHELATNAAKYGALSAPAGTLRVSWELSPEDIIVRWAETAPHRIEVPSAHGFGTKVIKSGVEQQLGGKVMMDWRPEGLLCVMRIPQVSGTGAPARRDLELSAPAAEAPVARQGRIARVLLVEDEALVAMMMQDLLDELGVEVVGPYGSAAEAMVAAKSEAFDAAILDVNLDGGTVYPLADMLAKGAIPFAFVTGYEPSTIDAAFRSVPVLQKPVERQGLSELLAFVGLNGTSAFAAQ
jgi:two-component sensor histidine kinase/DNA-binding response OmpR family regulator